jgi:FkbM family methyltransferase
MSDYSRELIRHVVKPGWVCVDAGANRGEMTLLMLECGAFRIISVEPVREFHEDLMAITSGRPVEPLRYALGSPDQVNLPWFSFPDEAGVNGGLSNDPACGFPVPMTTLDSILCGRHVHFIKLDVEGREREVLIGARTTLSTHHPVVLWETRHEFDKARGEPLREQCAGILLSLGYHLHRWSSEFGLVPIESVDQMGWDTLATP